MFVQNALLKKYQYPIKDTLDDLLTFLTKEMTAEKIEDFYERKLKDVKKLMVYQFDNIYPIRLSKKNVYDLEKTSANLKADPEFFFPLFFAYNITNNQYQSLSGLKNGKDFTELNRGSFADYYVSQKWADGVSKNNYALQVPTRITPNSLKEELLEEFYRVVNIEFGNKNVLWEEGTSILIDFSTLFELEEYSEQELTPFLQDLSEEYYGDVSINVPHAKQKGWLNGYIYLLESIHFQQESIFEIKENSIHNLLKMDVNTTFEAPTNEKKTLRNKRMKSVPSEEDLPKITFFEALLLRFLVISINKQGDQDTSGFTFPLMEGSNESTTIERTMQIVGNQYGNFSIRKIDIEDIREKKAFIKSITNSHLLVFDYHVKEKEAKVVFSDHFWYVKKNFFNRLPKQKELLEQRFEEKKYKECGVLIENFVLKHIDNCILSCEDEQERNVYKNDLESLLFVLNALTTSKNIEKVIPLTNWSLKDLSEKETLTNEEIYFILGSVVGLAVRSSRNSASLRKSFLKKQRLTDILSELNKRIESGIDEIEYLGLIKKGMQKVLSKLPTVDEKKSLTTTEKFAYNAGIVSEFKTNTQVTKTDKQEEAKHE